MMKTTESRRNVLELIVTTGREQTELGRDQNLSRDAKLRDVLAGLSEIARITRILCDETARLYLRDTLIKLAAYTLAWSMADAGTAAEAISAVLTERERQEQLLRDGKILFDCS